MGNKCTVDCDIFTDEDVATSPFISITLGSYHYTHIILHTQGVYSHVQQSSFSNTVFDCNLAVFIHIFLYMYSVVYIM